MADPQGSGLQLDEDMDRQHRIWRLQQAGWVLLSLFVLAGVLGAFGGKGVFSRAALAPDASGVRVEYPRFGRYVSPVELTVSVPGAALTGERLELALSRSWIDVFELYGISPQPTAERVAGEDMVYTFAVTPGQDAELSFFGRPHHVGTLSGSLRVAGGQRLAFSTFVYP